MAEIQSKRWGPKYAYDGHPFCFDRLNSEETIKFWRCDKRDSHICKALLHTSEATNNVQKLVNEHCHGSDAAGIEVTQICTVIQKRAEETQEAPAMILIHLYEDASVAVQGRLPSNLAMRKIIQRRRQKIMAAPAQPEGLASLVLPEAYSKYEVSPGQCEDFLLFDSGRILILGRKSHGDCFHLMKKFYLDGTFRIAPALFH